MMDGVEAGGSSLRFRELGRLGRQVWGLVSPRRRWELLAAAAIMMVTSAGNTGVALLLGRLIDGIQTGIEQDHTPTDLYRVAGQVLGGLCAIYLVREILHVGRRYLVEDCCTAINRNMQNRLVEHLLKIDLTALSREKIGALHGKIFRSVAGLVQFIRLMGLECVPAVFTGAIALFAAVTKQSWVGLVMLGVIPISVWLTLKQLKSQQGVRLKLMRDCEEIDGIVVEQLHGTEYIRVADTLQSEMDRLSQATQKRRQRELLHHFQMSLFGCAKALNEGFFHVVVLALATYLAINGQVTFGDILTFSVLFLNVMAPLNEIHRVVDEGHEASLRVAELLEMLHQPEDRAYHIPDQPEIQLKLNEPAIEVFDLVLDYTTADGQQKRGLNGVSASPGRQGPANRPGSKCCCG